MTEVPNHAGTGTGAPAERRANRYIDKLQVPVRLAQPGLDPRDGFLMLAPRIGSEDRIESLLELLNSRRTVIPFITEVDHSVLLINRTSIDWIAVRPSTPPGCILPPGVEWNQSERAELLFADRRRVEVSIAWYAENSGHRLSDFLNACDSFVASLAGFGLLIWNKNRVLEWRILGPGSRARDGRTGA